MNRDDAVTAIDPTALLALADAVPAGPWAVYQTMHAEPRVVVKGRGVMGTVAVPSHSPEDYGNGIAAYIAALDPDTVRALVAAYVEHQGCAAEQPVEHRRVGPARCACGYDAYKVGGFFPDYHAMFMNHLNAVRNGGTP